MDTMEQRAAWQAAITEKVWSDPEFKKALLANPKEVLAKELGIKWPANLNIHILEENMTDTYLVIPRNLGVTPLTDEQLENVAGGWDCPYGSPHSPTPCSSCTGTW